MTDTFRFTEDMREITGLGGFYERCCRAAVCAGAEWCAQHPHAVLHELPFAREVTLAIMNTPVLGDDGSATLLGEELTLSQVLLVADHVHYIATRGWKNYEQRMAST